jgi:hypothetical protein
MYTVPLLLKKRQKCHKSKNPPDLNRHGIQQGPVRFTQILKIAMLRVVLDWQKIDKTVSEKVFFFILWHFIFFMVLGLKNLEKGPS